VEVALLLMGSRAVAQTAVTVATVAMVQISPSRARLGVPAATAATAATRPAQEMRATAELGAPAVLLALGLRARLAALVAWVAMAGLAARLWREMAATVAQAAPAVTPESAAMEAMLS
jgi:hypothetical protein